MKTAKKKRSWKSFFSLIKSTKPNVALFVFACTISALSAVASTFVPSFLKEMIDSYVIAGGLRRSTLFQLIGLFFFSMLASVLSNYLLSRVGLEVVSNLRKMIWNKIVKLPVRFFDQNRSGDIASRLVSDSSVIYNLVSFSFAQFINAILTLLFCGVWLFYYSWNLTLVIAAVIPVFIAFFIPLGKVMAELSKKTQRSTADLNVNTIEMVSENKLIKSFTAEQKQMDRGKKNIEELMQIGLKQAKWNAVVTPFLNLIMVAMIVIVTGYGGTKLAAGELSPGTFMAFLTLLIYVMSPISNFGLFFSQLQKTKGATERIAELLSEEEERLNEGQAIDSTYTAIQVKDLCFKYGNEFSSGPLVLKDFNLDIQKGHTYALVGPSGGGKTTLMSLLERFYRPTQGQIFVDGVNMEDYSLTSWRSRIGYVPQEYTLINGTVKENLLFGLDVDLINESEIMKACQMAYAWDFIRELPKGLDTYIGEKGLNLSGGQRQRIAIARMFIKNPEIILLDEATASLDSQSEEHIQMAIKQITKGRTAIIIAHRLSTIMNVENIVFIEDGKITGKGKHNDLKENHKLYKKFCDLQFDGIYG